MEKKVLIFSLVLVVSVSFIFVFSLYGKQIGIENAPITGEAVTDNLKNLWKAITNPNECSVVGDRQCHVSRDNYYQVCEGKKTLSWRTYACDRGLICSGGDCVCSSDDACSSEGERECRGSRIYECTLDNNGCLKWSRGTRCGRGTACVDGECVLVHCSDNIQNYDEEGIDCGGVDCEACPPACVEDWQCGVWSTCFSSQQTRTCSDLNNCGRVDEVETQICCSDSCSSLNYECGVQIVCSAQENCGICIEGYVCEAGICEEDVVVPPPIEPPVLGANQHLVNLSDVISISTNQGDTIEVTYNQIWQDSAVVTVRRASTSDSTRIRESHTVTIEEISATRVRVTVV